MNRPPSNETVSYVTWRDSPWLLTAYPPSSRPPTRWQRIAGYIKALVAGVTLAVTVTGCAQEFIKGPMGSALPQARGLALARGPVAPTRA